MGNFEWQGKFLADWIFCCICALFSSLYIYTHPLQHIPSPLKDSQRPHWTLFSGSIHRWIGRITPGRGIYHDIGRSQEIFRGHGRIGAISWRKPPTNAISVPMRFSGIWKIKTMFTNLDDI